MDQKKWIQKGAIALVLAASLSIGCESKPVVEEAVEGGEAREAVETEGLGTTNVREAEGVEEMPGMPDNAENVLPGAE